MTQSARTVVDRMFTAFNAKDLPGALATVSAEGLACFVAFL